MVQAGPDIEAAAGPSGGRVVAVVVTRDRPALLQQCLRAVLAQERRPDLVLVVDNASGPETAQALAGVPGLIRLRFERNLGGAGGFRAGIEAALEAGADWVWLMDDDGRPETPACLGVLLGTAAEHAADLVGPLVVDTDRRDRLSFPVRIAGRTLFGVDEVAARGTLPGFAHLFNGALVAAALFRRVGLPDARFFIRGDEVEFLFRTRAHGGRVVLETSARFLHPGSEHEIFPIMRGMFYAVVPGDEFKRYHQFRNRSYIFRTYGMWGWLAADVVRYGWYYLVCRHADVRGFGRWAAATLEGVGGRFMRDGPAPPAPSPPAPRA